MTDLPVSALNDNAMALAVDANLHAVVDKAVTVHARADARFVEEVHCHLFDHAGADAAEHVFAGVSLDNDVVDAVALEKLAEQQSGRPGADNGDLSAHQFTFP